MEFVAAVSWAGLIGIASASIRVSPEDVAGSFSWVLTVACGSECAEMAGVELRVDLAEARSGLAWKTYSNQRPGSDKTLHQT